MAEEEVWIRKGIKARRTRNEGRVRALKKMREERRQEVRHVDDRRERLYTGAQSAKHRDVASTAQLFSQFSGSLRSEYAAALAPVVAALWGRTGDPRVFADKALSFVQAIPYEQRAKVSDR